MRVLLTGSAGFVGGAVAEQLLAAGHEVVPVDLMLAQAHTATEPPAGTHRLDVRDAATDPVWAELLVGVDAVCHQAAMVGAGVDAEDLPLYAGHNDLGTAAVLAAMARADVRRLVLASSMVVYGEGRYACPEHGPQPATRRSVADLEAGRFDPRCPVCGGPLDWALVPESAPLDPRSTYAVSKLAQEHYAQVWAAQVGGSVVALRYHNIYGPRMPRDTPYSGVAAMFRSWLERGEAPRVFEDGRQQRDFVHVDDVARANLAALAATEDGERFAAYNVCSGLPVSIEEVARAVAAASGGPEPVVTGEYRIGDVRHVVADPALAARELGFTAQVRPEEGLRAFADDPLRR